MAFESVTAFTALAEHPGHGSSDPNEVAHYLLEPVHVIVLGTAVAALLFVLLRSRRARRLADSSKP